MPLTSSWQGEVRCDGQRHEITAAGSDGSVAIDIAIDPYQTFVDSSGQITIEHHSLREYIGDSDEPLTVQFSGTGQMESATSMSLNLLNESLGFNIPQHYTKIGG